MLVRIEGKTLLHVNGKRLIPGVNTVDVQWWTETRKHPSIIKRMELGIITEETPFKSHAKMKPKQATEADFDHLSTMTVANAKRLVAETVDLRLLREWYKREERKPVEAALEKQIEALESDTPMRDRSKSRSVSTGRGPDHVHVEAKPSKVDD